jgi:glycosyltransferase involved in cell wall biosynthesis
MSKPVVSVLMTAFNREDYIADAIESVLASSFHDFELIIVDDCSSDRTVEIATAYTLQDQRIRLYINEKNVGQFANRNKAASFAQAELLKFLDSDDVLYPHSLKIFVDALLIYPEAAAASECHFVGSSYIYPYLFTNQELLFNHYFKNSSLLNIGPSGTIFRRKTFESIGGFDIEIGILADTLFMLQVALTNSVVGLPRDLFYWRRHSNQVTEGQNLIVEMINQRMEINSKILNSNDFPLNRNDKAIIRKNLNKIYIANLLKLLGKGNLSGMKKLLQNFNLTRIN